MPTFTQLAIDAFTTYGPTYPALLTSNSNWSVFSTDSSLEVTASGVVGPSVGSLGGCGNTYTGVSWPANQYSQITIGKLSTATYYDCHIRASASANTRAVVEINSSSTTQYLYVVVNGTAVETYTFTATLAASDVWTLWAIGSTYTISQNGIVRLTQVDTNISSGSAGFGMEAVAAGATDGTITLWSGGSVPTGVPNSLATMGCGI